jgi:hypothetical protein
MSQTWFECKVKFTKTDQNGSERAVTESYMLDAVTFTDAEARIILQMKQRVKGGFSVDDIKKSKISEVFVFDKGEWWFRTIINLVTVDEEAGKEKKVKAWYLLNADDMKEALQRLEESLAFLVIPYFIASVSVSLIADVFPYEIFNVPIPEGMRSFDELLSERKFQLDTE